MTTAAACVAKALLVDWRSSRRRWRPLLICCFFLCAGGGPGLLRAAASSSSSSVAWIHSRRRRSCCNRHRGGLSRPPFDLRSSRSRGCRGLEGEPWRAGGKSGRGEVGTSDCRLGLPP
nr:unnamed protein product [Digitaria exilis]